jgi:hypothetical protein
MNYNFLLKPYEIAALRLQRGGLDSAPLRHAGTRLEDVLSPERDQDYLD